MKSAFFLFILVLTTDLIFSKKADFVTLAKETQDARQCKPFGVRLNWGKSIIDSTSA